MNFLIRSMASLFCSLTETIVLFFTTQLIAPMNGLSNDLFLTYFGDTLNVYYIWVKALGILIMTGILVFQIFKSMFYKAAATQTDSVPMMIIKFILITTLILNSVGLMGWFVKLVQYPMSSIAYSSETANEDVKNTMSNTFTSINNQFEVDDNGNAVGDTIKSIGGAVVGTITGYNVIASIIMIILFIAIGWKLIKFLLEILERYVLFHFLLLFFPLVAGAAISKSTAGIFRKYLEMVISSFILSFLNLLMLRLILGAMSSIFANASTSLVLGVFIIFAMINIASSMDTHMGKILSTAGITGPQFGFQAGMLLRAGGRALGALTSPRGANAPMTRGDAASLKDAINKNSGLNIASGGGAGSPASGLNTAGKAATGVGAAAAGMAAAGMASTANASGSGSSNGSGTSGSGSSSGLNSAKNKSGIGTATGSALNTAGKAASTVANTGTSAKNLGSMAAAAGVGAVAGAGIAKATSGNKTASTVSGVNNAKPNTVAGKNGAVVNGRPKTVATGTVPKAKYGSIDESMGVMHSLSGVKQTQINKGLMQNSFNQASKMAKNGSQPQDVQSIFATKAVSNTLDMAHKDHIDDNKWNGTYVGPTGDLLSYSECKSAAFGTDGVLNTNYVNADGHEFSVDTFNKDDRSISGGFDGVDGLMFKSSIDGIYNGLSNDDFYGLADEQKDILRSVDANYAGLNTLENATTVAEQLQFSDDARSFADMSSLAYNQDSDRYLAFDASGTEIGSLAYNDNTGCFDAYDNNNNYFAKAGYAIENEPSQGFTLEANDNEDRFASLSFDTGVHNSIDSYGEDDLINLTNFSQTIGNGNNDVSDAVGVAGAVGAVGAAAVASDYIDNSYYEAPVYDDYYGDIPDYGEIPYDPEAYTPEMYDQMGYIDESETEQAYFGQPVSTETFEDAPDYDEVDIDAYSELADENEAEIEEDFYNSFASKSDEELIARQEDERIDQYYV